MLGSDDRILNCDRQFDIGRVLRMARDTLETRQNTAREGKKRAFRQSINFAVLHVRVH